MQEPSPPPESNAPPEAPERPAPQADSPASENLAAFEIALARLSWSQPFQWLRLGWKDFLHHPGIGLFYGFCFMVMGLSLLKVYQNAPAYTLALSAGFMLMGPFLCMGLYQVSMRLERGEQPDLGDSLTAWDTHMGQMAIFGGVLLILEMLWARSALVIFAVSFDGMPDLGGSIWNLINEDNLGFIVTYLAVGAVFAGLIYAVSVISIPMMLDQQVDAVTAGLTSMRLVLSQTGVMLLWGLLVSTLVVVAMIPWFAGLLVVGPVIGHASWHAYRAAVHTES
ncbi:MAG: DUF2189 domain-containing protein [Burkholderiaceae bacterium]|nr:DUF2189 domain-containing protein [Burkholderiaceae bacterium]